ncbi:MULTISPECIES: DUF2970 domain-containing protein [Reinekea]|jgi:hypothetical protein|uniref:DUF2970 domain-containing protein n=1 Tax=Reinekea forsetii TaxID=1336806 RepID=A0A2K8KPY1_9GAMM|nr:MULTISPECIES: DUF2970 domain-containing protein [Reinekea]ATX76827.1 hypothetical protein REIFOR_01685 [Reinekea forsetii]MDO7634307.1 DUF2970 domain-containing protein [Porticoccaceae bacterium]MDO7642427.1 DUF2970 domain-containing protein [Reinekea forsetii]
MIKLNKPGFWQVTKSVLSAVIGVQSNRNRLQDFASPSIWPFVAGGLIFTVLFVGGLIALVSIVA